MLYFLLLFSRCCVWLFATPWTAACQASLSFTIFQSLLKFMSIESVMPTNYLICCPLVLPSSLTGCQSKARMENWRPHHHLQVVLQPQEHPLGSSSSSNRNSSSSSICSTWPNSLELELLWPPRPEGRPGQCRAQWPTGMRDERVGATWP